MFYGCLNNSNFIPKIVEIKKVGKGFRARLINESTGFDKYITFTELNKLLNNVKAYRVSRPVVDYIESMGDHIFGIPLLNRVKCDMKYGNCVVE